MSRVLDNTGALLTVNFKILVSLIFQIYHLEISFPAYCDTHLNYSNQKLKTAISFATVAITITITITKCNQIAKKVDHRYGST